MKKLFSFLLVGLLLSGCAFSRKNPANQVTTSTAQPVATATQPAPTNTPIPTITATVSPTPDFTSIGLPVESSANKVFDFVDQMCNAQWFTKTGDLPCPGDQSQADAGYVMKLNGEIQNLSSNIDLLLTFPPQTGVETISSKYPTFTVKSGDRFRAVLACRAHSFCDVEFVLDYFDSRGQNGITHWRYLFANSPIVVDYPLDGIAGKTVQFDLAVQTKGNRIDGSAVWIAPHIYRPTP
ncbi:MAG TPA: hypothetical protein VMT73_14235 [Anaerolineales bacterium]|nr:hypothetical protein [Anaerolineales bacterium]